MKKKGLVVGVLGALLLTACGVEEGENLGTSSIESNFTKVKEGGDVDIYKDNQTGCQYLYYRSDTSYSAVGGFFPYYNEEGKVKGCGDLN